jgi:hypothetical protein
MLAGQLLISLCRVNTEQLLNYLNTQKSPDGRLANETTDKTDFRATQLLIHKEL